MSDPLFTLGARRSAEILQEVAIPIGVSIAAWKVTRALVDVPTANRPLSQIELAVLLALLVVALSWYGGRQLTMFGQRRPWRVVIVTAVVAMIAVFSLGTLVRTGFDAQCEALGGRAVEPLALRGRTAARVCQIGAIGTNPYLPGTLLRAPWSGVVPPWLWVALGLTSGLTTLAMRDVRLRRTRLGLATTDLLRLAPSAGGQSVRGGPGKRGLQACGNATLWGELCGQLYAAEKVFEPGEWCVRCSQTYHRCERELTFTVVSLFTADVDVLNGLERLDTLAWEPGEPMPPDARLSGQERWTTLGRFTVPDVITVAQLLGLVHERLGAWAGDAADNDQDAFTLAERRASRLAAWIWMGPQADRLTYARPTDKALLALGPSRLRDLMLDAGEELTLQLEIGVMPVELRSANRKTFLEPDRAPLTQNTKQDIWVPVAPDTRGLEGGWVPRIEGDALRRWLSLDRARPSEIRGVSTPLPYLPLTGDAPPVRAGELDLVRCPLDLRTHEPLLGVRPGDSISEWRWMEWQQIELLRQQALVLVSR